MAIRWQSVVAGLAALGIVGGIAVIVVDRINHPQAAAVGDKHSRGTGVVPVVAGLVSREDMPLWLDGIGTAQAYNSVVVRVRVDGELHRLAFREGQEVKAGEVLAQIDPRPYQASLAQAEAKKAQDEAQLANARRDLERNLGLHEYAARQQVDTQRALVTQMEAQVRADQAAVESAAVQLGYTTIAAPINGRIGLRTVDQGNMVHAADANGLATITQIQPIAVVFTLPEKYLPQILEAQRAGPVRVDALDRDGQAILGSGSLTVIDNQIDSSTATIRLKATLPNDPPSLWPGQFVNVRLLASIAKGGTVIPDQAVQRGPQGTYAYVIRDDQTVEQRLLVVTRLEGGKALINSGLTPGEHIVIDGQYRLQVGAKVRISEPAPAEKKTERPTRRDPS